MQMPVCGTVATPYSRSLYTIMRTLIRYACLIVFFLHIYILPLAAISFTDEVRFLGKAISREIKNLRTPAGNKIRSFNLIVEDPSLELLTISRDLLATFLTNAAGYRERGDSPGIIIVLSLRNSDEGLWLIASVRNPKSGNLRAITAREITWNETVHSMLSLRDPLLEHKRGGQLVAVYDVRHDTIDPANLTTDDERRISLNLFEPLGEISSIVSPDEQVWTITLKTGIRFSDGSPLTAADVARSLQRLQSHSGAPIVSYFNSLQPAISCSDDRTLVVTLADSCPRLISLLSFPEFGIAREDTASSFLLGSGPFRQVGASPDQLTFRPADDTRAILSEITVIPANRAGDASLLFDINGAGQIPLNPELYRKYKDNPGVDLVAKRGTRTDYLLVVNPGHREMLGTAIDREALTKVVLRGLAKTVSSPLAAAIGDTAIPVKPENLTLAYRREQLPTGAVIHKLQTDFKRSGITVTLLELPETEFKLSLKNRSADLYYLTWSSFHPDPLFSKIDFQYMTGQRPDGGHIIELFQLPALAVQQQSIHILGRDKYADNWKNLWKN